MNLLLVGLIGPAGCHDPRPPAALPAQGEALPILRSFAGMDSGEATPMHLAIRTAADWARIPLVDDSIDFEHEMALVVTLGKTTGQSQAVRILQVYRQGTRLHVDVALERPPANDTITVATPFAVAIVPRCDLEVAGFLPSPPPDRKSRDEDIYRSLPRNDAARPNARVR